MRFRMSTVTVTVLAALCAAGCSNPFRQSYKSSLERWPSGEASRLLPAEGPAKIVTSENMREDATRMMENGYLLLGRSRFQGPQVDPATALKQAKEVGASVVLLEKKYTTTITETVPMSEWIPPRDVKVREKVTIETGPNAGQTVEREVTRTIEGEFQTTHVPQTTDYYEYAATFWGKSKPPIFGVLVRALNTEEKQRIQSNRGVLIRAVIHGSPAFHADILRDDVITSFGGVPITDPDQFFDTVVENQGREVTVDVVRGTETKSFTLRLLTD